MIYAFTKPRSLRAIDVRAGDQMAFIRNGDSTEWLADARSVDESEVIWTVVSSIDGGGILRFRFINGYFEEMFEDMRVVIRETAA